MSDLRSIGQAFHRAAPRYDARASQQREVMARLYELAQPHWGGAPFVLDVGCGTGALKDLAGETPVIGIDLAQGMCQQAVSKGMPSLVADMHRLPLQKASVSALFSSLALQWSAHLERCLTHWCQIAHPNAIVALSTYLSSTLNELSESFKAIGLVSPVQVFVEHEVFLNVISKAGFRVVYTECNTFKVEYSNLKSLIKYMKEIGASSPSTSSITLRTPSQFRRLEAAYLECYGSIHSGWEVGYYLLQKKA